MKRDRKFEHWVETVTYQDLHKRAIAELNLVLVGTAEFRLSLDDIRSVHRAQECLREMYARGVQGVL